ncbi:DUF1223 domain-containing protein [Granulicella arctica]|uniref:DUF1223 domain-containing protein n=1 Tax=Granulicella arctica TaxID=940613 RepID=A0A7Y9TH94_9BACT|nr:DUF1223 domain-containing protein [Granulicella arctica]NYF80801.1 hypothetical protein [Granulicella arctica]
MALLLSAAVVTGQIAKPANPAVRPKIVLVELFTSEGCSSCPPADALLRQINGTKTASGQLIVGISEHVTYWNSLGWSDPFSSSVYTARQDAYGVSLGLDSIYTPQMVVNGTEQFVGSSNGDLAKALRREQEKESSVDLRIVSTSVVGNMLTVKFSVTSDASVHGADIIAVLTDDNDQSSVSRGENSGRTLAHVSVARSIVRIAEVQREADQTAQIALPDHFGGKEGHHLILFVQTARSGRVLGAATQPL